MEIFDIEKQHVPNCAEAFMASYNEHPWNYDWKLPDAIKYLHEYVDAPQFKGYMALENGRVAGALFGHAKTWWTNGQFMIDELFIAADMQGKGLGKTLLKQAEQHAKTNGMDRIILMTNKFMPALEFYNKNDFENVGQYVFMFKQLA